MFVTDANIALRQPAIQSSDRYAGTEIGGWASNAVDGSLTPHTSTNPYKFYCTHTNQEDEPWWAVDLGNVTDVGYIKVTSRSDCCRKS